MEWVSGCDWGSSKASSSTKNSEKLWVVLKIHYNMIRLEGTIISTCQYKWPRKKKSPERNGN